MLKELAMIFSTKNFSLNLCVALDYSGNFAIEKNPFLHQWGVIVGRRISFQFWFGIKVYQLCKFVLAIANGKHARKYGFRALFSLLLRYRKTVLKDCDLVVVSVVMHQFLWLFRFSNHRTRIKRVCWIMAEDSIKCRKYSVVKYIMWKRFKLYCFCLLCHFNSPNHMMFSRIGKGGIAVSVLFLTSNSVAKS